MENDAPKRILIAEDDRAARDALARALELEGYAVDAVGDGALALEAIEQDPPDLLLLDVMMPTVDGLAVCRRLRSRRDDLPILILTARTETSDRVVGLDAGADDYLPKPYDLDELLARIRALLRRTSSPAGETLTVADLEIDLGGRTVRRAGSDVSLSKTEFDLLELLVRNKGIVLDRETIHDRIWGYDFGPESKNLAVYVGYLRRKIELDGRPQLLQTVRGVGYVVREP